MAAAASPGRRRGLLAIHFGGMLLSLRYATSLSRYASWPKNTIPFFQNLLSCNKMSAMQKILKFKTIVIFYLISIDIFKMV